MSRTVRTLHPAHRDDIGDLVTRRPLPGPRLAQLDPFLFLNHHGPMQYGPNNQGLPFGPHPHRGFETVTFILEGDLAHLDSGGHASVIHAGGVQWMTAGSGLIHAEVSPSSFKRSGGPLEILQLWVNLPSRLKMTAPAYTGLQREDIPVVTLDEGRAMVDVIAGEVFGVTGPVASLTGVTMTTVALRAGGEVSLPAPAGQAVFLYVVSGEASIGSASVAPWQLIELNDDGDDVQVAAVTDARVLYGYAAPLAEPVVAQGPFVMNTREEIAQAARDYYDGKFGGVPDSRAV